ncbi:MAG: Capsular polysaccharide biosynthesis protein [Herbinix sp.]|nr:Capsular polysaccharide biosynthesis protein [Herbinix sp.]
MKYIDIHTHILPGVDDGSGSMEETIMMLQAAQVQQIETIVATPHYIPGGSNLSVDALRERLEQVQAEAYKINSNMKLFLGNEIYYSDSIIEDLKAGKVLTIANSRYILVEFSPKDPEQHIYQAMSRLVRAGYIPILAHVERYRCFYKKEYLIHDLIEAGCYIQMNSRSLVGNLLDSETAYHRSLIKLGLVHLIASDCHDEKVRIPYMKKAAQIMTRKYDENLVNKILFSNPLKILGDKYI